ncbi:MAG TPA: histone H1-like repetitive region-containing protein [Aquihabitans sp.]|jgi:polyhydroxyalkanoate synthesis regulator phasin|nr:histone H1-like repetitive region-containing protein [Aquihabitans sp.]
MAENNLLKRYLDAGMAFTAITQARAEALVRDLVKAGEVQTEQAQDFVTDLIERSRANTEALVSQVLQELASQAESLGLATIADLTRVERLVESIRPGTRSASSTTPPTEVDKDLVAGTAVAPAKKAVARASSAKKTTARKASAKKAPAKKTAAKKTAAKKTAAKKAPAKKAAAKKAAAKKSPAKRSAAKKTAS